MTAAYGYGMRCCSNSTSGADITPETNVVSTLPDWIINKPPAGCGGIIPITRFPPNPLSESLEGIEGLVRPNYYICVADDGTIGDFINGRWTARAIRWKTVGQAGKVALRKDTPDDWTWFDTEPVEGDRAKQYEDADGNWRVIVSLNLGRDSTGAGYYGQMYIRNFRTQRWEKYYQLCDPDLPVPAVPRNLSITAEDEAQRSRITLAWQPPRAPTPPSGYRYRLFRKTQFDSDETYDSLMSGYTTFLEVSEIHLVDPPERYYLEVRAEYLTGNSNWTRIEGLIGLACASDPLPNAPDLFYTDNRSRRLASTVYDGVQGAEVSSITRATGNYQYPGSGPRPVRVRDHARGCRRPVRGRGPIRKSVRMAAGKINSGSYWMDRAVPATLSCPV